MRTMPERLARFEREAKVLASLNHPNIATIYAVEESPEGKALVMELVPGETLKGPAPLELALKYAAQIASALEAAHEKGITHRDLKPGNIMLTPEGVIKVLDFGLAAVTMPTADDRRRPDAHHVPHARGHDPGHRGLHEPGTSARQAVDRRADIWSFGVVLYELLTGKRLFQGDDVADTLAAVLRQEPSYEGVPVSAHRLLKACLEKDPKKRLRDIGDWGRLLEEPVGHVPDLPKKNAKLPWIAVAALAVALTGVTLLHFREAPLAQQSLRYTMSAPQDGAVNYFAISPDGHYLVMAATASGKRQLWLRAMDTRPCPSPNKPRFRSGRRIAATSVSSRKAS